MTLHEKLVDIQFNLKTAKTRKNNFGNYSYRSAEDILEACKPLLNRHKLTIVINEDVLVTGSYPILKSTATITDGTDSIAAVSCVGIDEHQKGMQMPQKFGSSSSYAKKYALGNLLMIDETKDSDATNQHKKESANSTIAKIHAMQSLDELFKFYNENESAFSKDIAIMKEFTKMKKVLK